MTIRFTGIAGCLVAAVVIAVAANQPAAGQTAIAQSTSAGVPKFIAKDLTAWADHPWSRLPPLSAVKITERLQQSKKRWTEVEIEPDKHNGGVTLAREISRTWDGYSGDTFRSFLGFFRLSGTVDSSRFDRFQEARRFTKLKRLPVPTVVPMIAGVDPRDLAIEFEFDLFISGRGTTMIVDTTVIGSGSRDVRINGETVKLNCYTLTHRVRQKLAGGYAKTKDVGYCPQLGFYTDYRWEISGQFVDFVDVTLQFEVKPEQLARLKAGQ